MSTQKTKTRKKIPLEIIVMIKKLKSLGMSLSDIHKAVRKEIRGIHQSTVYYHYLSSEQKEHKKLYYQTKWKEKKQNGKIKKNKQSSR